MNIEKKIFNEIIFITELIINELPNDLQLKHDFQQIITELVESNNHQKHSMRVIKRIYLKYKTNEFKVYDKKVVEYIKTIQSLIKYLNNYLLLHDITTQEPITSSLESCLFYFFDILESLIK